MNTSIADRLRVGNEVRELKLGKSFTSGGSSTFHSVRYDFKPASVDTTKVATVEVGEKHQVTVTVPHIEGSGTAHTVFKGSQKPYQKECVLIVDNVTGEITLERLTCNIQLKKTRAEGSSKIQPRPITPIDGGSKKCSPSQKQPSPSQKTPHSPNQKMSWSSTNHNSPSQKNLLPQSSHLQQPRISPSHQKSPTNHASPSMPTLMPSCNSRPPSVGRDCSSNPIPSESAEPNEAPDIGVLSDSSESSNSSNDGSSSSDSSDSEHETQMSHKVFPPKNSTGGNVNGMNGQNSNSSYASMPRFNQLSQLSEDLQLSESESDSND